MKQFLTLFLSFLVIATSSMMAQTKDENKPEMTFEKTEHDFGSFKESDGPVTCVFKFTNTGKGMLVIHQAIATCGCTVPIYPKELIKPGESGEIKVTYNGKGRRAGEFEKNITIRANTKAQIYRLKVKGSMIAK